MILLHAKTLPDGTTELVFDTGFGRIVGGIARMTSFKNEYKRPSLMDAINQTNMSSTMLQFTWLWQKTISVEQYEAQRQAEEINPPIVTIEHEPQQTSKRKKKR